MYPGNIEHTDLGILETQACFNSLAFPRVSPESSDVDTSCVQRRDILIIRRIQPH
jgi:hypothetical protein